MARCWMIWWAGNPKISINTCGGLWGGKPSGLASIALRTRRSGGERQHQQRQHQREGAILVNACWWIGMNRFLGTAGYPLPHSAALP